jgi:hypothetical protein
MPFFIKNYNTLFPIFLYNIFPTNSKPIALNVPAVNEGFLCPIRKMRSILRAQKTLAERKPHKGA